MNGRFVSYLRVSTDKQGRSGLGLEAQRASVAAYLNGGDWTLVAEFVEVESGKQNSRPKLAEAMAVCRAHRATLVIAKLDRLSRDTVFLLSMERSGIEFIDVENPKMNRMTLGIRAVIAEEERRMISTRTKEALAAAKARGKKLGGFRGTAGTPESVAYARAAHIAAADKLARALQPVLSRIDPNGSMSLRALASALESEQVPTVKWREANKGKANWTAAGVARLRARIAALPDIGVFG